MRIKGHYFTFKQVLCLSLYYGFAIYLPNSQSMFFGNLCRNIRYKLCKHIFRKCGINVNIEHGAVFGRGTDVEIGDFSGIGINSHIPSNAKIGKYVMMGPNCYVLDVNHAYSQLDIPMCFQGHSEKEGVTIQDDCWIGRNVIMTPGRNISKGTIIAAGCILCKDFPDYSIVGGNPSRLIKSRKSNDNI